MSVKPCWLSHEETALALAALTPNFAVYALGLRYLWKLTLFGLLTASAKAVAAVSFPLSHN